MAIHDPLTSNLDNLRFQADLVDEARKRIIRYCPEWTEYNVSDPGITLIELFAWMTEQIIYRLNLIPRKNYVKFLEMLGIQLEPPVAARTELTFYLSAPFPLRPDRPGERTHWCIPEGTQISAMAPDNAAITFTTDQCLTINTPRLTQLRPQNFSPKNYYHESTNKMDEFKVFDDPMGARWAYFYLGFDPTINIAGHILRLHVECASAQGTGSKPSDPPWEWHACVGEETGARQSNLQSSAAHDENGAHHWEMVVTGKMDEERDTTGGFNYPKGHLTLYLPLAMKPSLLHGLEAYWVRCALCTDPNKQNCYQKSPVIQSLRVEVLGASTTASNAITVTQEVLGVSSGEPGQIFYLKQTPLLPLRAANGEVIEVEEVILHSDDAPNSNRQAVAFQPQFVPWEKVENFAHSTQHDRHYAVDLATGEVRFGPAIRQRDGSIRQYGRIPALGMKIRMQKYRYSRGAKGNVPRHQVSVLHQSIPYVDRVTNWERVTDGRDQESLEEAMLRAQRLLRAQQRAVTASDYELLAKQHDRSIARVKCITPQLEDAHGGANGNSAKPRLAPGQVRLLIVPAAYEGLQQNDFSQFALRSDLERVVRRRLGAFRLLTSTLDVRAPNYLGVFIDAQIVVDERRNPQQVEEAVNRALRAYITPLRPAPLASAHNGSDPGAQKINIEIDETSDPAVVRAQLEAALQRLAARPAAEPAASTTAPAPWMASLDRTEPGWEGWPFGEPLSRAELFALIQAVPGVRHVREVAMYILRLPPDKDLTSLRWPNDPARTNAANATTEVVIEPPPLRPLAKAEREQQLQEQDYVWEPVTTDRLLWDGVLFNEETLLCSPLNHRVTSVTL